MEVELGCKGVISDLYDIAEHWCVNGQHWCSEESPLQKDLQIIGVGDNAILKFDNSMEMRNANIYIENVTITLDDFWKSNEEYLISVSRGKLWLRNCFIDLRQISTSFSSAILVNNGGNLDVDNCKFITKLSDFQCHAMFLTPTAHTVKVTNSIFKHFGHRKVRDSDEEESGCICVWDREFTGTRGYNLTLECIGNVFENNHCYPFVEMSDANQGYYIYNNTNKYELRDNTLKGFNKPNTYKRKALKDGNTLNHFQYGPFPEFW